MVNRLKFLHIADLHLGRLLYGRSLIEDQRHFLFENLLPAIDRHKPDGVLIAGDLYDRPVASTEAIALFDALLDALSARQVPTVVISGNHDGPERIAVGAKMLARFGIHIVTSLDAAFQPIELGGAQIFALPYFDNAQMRAFLGDETLRGAGACMRAAVEKMAAQFAPGKLHVLVAHCFAAGASTSAVRATCRPTASPPSITPRSATCMRPSRPAARRGTPARRSSTRWTRRTRKRA